MKRRFALPVCVAALAGIAILVFLEAGVQGQETGALVMKGSLGLIQEPPTVEALSPNEAPNNLDATITITGTGFQAVLSDTEVLTAPVISLDGFPLAEAGWVSSRTLTGTIPWGLDPGVYTATVTNPDGQYGSLTRAFTVTQAIGVWTSGGPYAGSIHKLAVSPVNSQRAFAWAADVGLFGTEDGGDNWDLRFYDSGGWGVGYGIMPKHSLYFWGVSGLWRSDDEGQTFQKVAEGIVETLAPHPQDEQKLWIGKHPYGVLYTDNGGMYWQERSAGLPTDSVPKVLAIDPVTPSTLYVGLGDGRVFKTTDAGLNWTEASNGLPELPYGPRTLAIDPFAPNVLLLAPSTGPAPAFRSEDSGATWSPVEIEFEDNIITDVALSPHVPGTVYGTWTGSGYFAGVSTDGGATWEALTDFGRRSDAVSIGLDPASGLPAYLGGLATGAWRSSDGGLTWELATSGITGMLVQDVASVPGQPQRVFVAGEGASGFVSDNAGQSWLELELPYTFAEAIAVDPQQPQRIYISCGRGMFLSQDGGTTWDQVGPLHPTADLFAESVAVDPNAANVVYAAGRDDAAFCLERSVGLAALSQDYGATWQPITFTLPVSAVAQIVVHPRDPLTLYVAAGRWTWNLSEGPGKGFFRSRDGGQTWEQSAEGMGAAFAIAVHPDRPKTLYATAWLGSEGKVTVFRSKDAGDTWAATSLRVDYDYRGNPLVVDPADPDTLLAGGRDGLFRSIDGGASWTRAAGAIGRVAVTSLSSATDGERTISYVGTTGGLVGGALGGQEQAVPTADSEIVAGGVYQLTLIEGAPATIYLPLVVRSR